MRSTRLAPLVETLCCTTVFVIASSPGQLRGDINDHLTSTANNGDGLHANDVESFGEGDLVLPFSMDHEAADGDPEGKYATASGDYALGADLFNFLLSQAPNNSFTEGLTSGTSNTGTLTFSPLTTTDASFFFGDEGGFSWDGNGSKYDVDIEVSLVAITGAPLPALVFGFDETGSTGGSITWEDALFTLTGGEVYQLSYRFNLNVQWDEFGVDAGSGSGFFQLQMPDGTGIELVPVPAPSAALLATLGLCCLYWRRRRPA